MKSFKPKKAIIIGGIFLMIAIIFVSIQMTLPRFSQVTIPEDDESLGIQEPKEEVIEEETSEEKVDIFKNQREKTLNILMLGTDQSVNGEGSERSDIMMLVSLKKDDPVVNLTSFMRDTIAQVPSTGNLEKLNANYAYEGSLGVIRALNVNYDLNIRDYVKFDYEAIAALVDAVGGVRVYVEPLVFEDINKLAKKEKSLGAEPLEKHGWNTLDGRQAILFSRTRYYTGGDTARVARQREVLKEVVKKVQGSSPTKLYEIAKEVMPLVESSYSLEDVFTLMDYFVQIRRGMTFSEATFPYQHGGYRYNGVWYEVSRDLEEDLIKLHDEIFDDKYYRPSDRAFEIIQEIESIPFY